MYNKKTFLLFSFSLSFLVLYTACGNPPPGPTLSVTLSNKIVVLGKKLNLSVKVTNFVLDGDLMGKENQVGVGHYNVYIDKSMGNGYLHRGSASSLQLKLPKGLKLGKHTVRILLMQNNDTILIPLVEVTKEFELAKTDTGKPSVKFQINKSNLKPGEAVELTITAKNFKLIDFVKDGNPRKNKDGEGHYHVYFDGNSASDYLIAEHKEKATITIPASAALGEHTLRVQLMQNGHTPLSPTVEATIKIKVGSSGEKPSVAAKVNKSKVVAGETLTLTVTPSNFRFSAGSIGGSPRKGEGHYHVYLDDNTGSNYLANVATSQVDIVIPKDTSNGEHLLHIILRENDHSPLKPKVEAIVKINVTALLPSVSVQAKSKTVETDSDLKLTIQTTNFQLDPNSIGKAHVAGSGHYRIYIDKKKGNDVLVINALKNISVRIPRTLSKGSHKIVVQLYQNDKKPVTPIAKGEITITVKKGNPTLKISLNPNKIFPNGDLSLSINVRNFQLDGSKIGKANKPGVGHYKVYLDGKSGKNYLKRSVETHTFVTSPKSISVGAHILTVSLRNNDGNELSPPIQARIDFRVTEDPFPKLSVTSSSTSIEVGASISLKVSVKNFVLDEKKKGKVNKLGTGHYNVYLDGNKGSKYLYSGDQSQTKITIPKTTSAGKHTLRISLRNNDGIPFTPRLQKIINLSLRTSTAPSVTLKILNPNSKPGDKVSIEITTINFKLNKQAIGKANKKGEGHFHVYLDNNTGGNYLSAGADKTSQVLIPISTKPGSHKLKVVLFNNDHSLYSPKTETSKSFDVIDTKPKINFKVSNPKVKPGQKIRLTVNVLNFKLSATTMGKANKKGEGHYHVYLDNNTGGNYLAVSAKKSIDVLMPISTSAGKHKLRVQLMNNDHSPIQPIVQSSASIDVSNGASQLKCAATYAGCKSYADKTYYSREITFGGSTGNVYSPKCIKIKVGQSITFIGKFTQHPLEPACEEAPAITKTTSGTKRSFTFTKAGYYNYYCTFHGGKARGTGMAGSIYVIP